MEDWQEWQIRADQVAAALRQEVDTLEQAFFSESGESNFRGFWPRFKELKERVRVAPAIKLEDKLHLERRLRDLGSRAYKGQEAAYGRSGERKSELLATIASLRTVSENQENPKDLRNLRRDLDAVRAQFDEGSPLMPPDRQAVWEAWKEASQFVWDRLTTIWSNNEEHLRGLLGEGRRQLEARQYEAVRQTVGKFFDALKVREARQNAINALKSEANAIRTETHQVEERRTADRHASQQVQLVSPIESWKAELDRNRDALAPISQEVAALEQKVQDATSILEQAMLRGTLVDKRRKVQDLERASRTLEQRIRQAEETPLMTAG